MIFDTLSKFNNRIALIENEVVFTYEQLIELSETLTKEIPSRSLVFLCCDNTIHTIAYYVGLLRKKSVPLLLPATMQETFLKKLISTYRPSYIIKCEKNTDKIKCPTTVSSKLHNDLALLLTTSGSTGSSKLVRLSYNNIVANTKSIIQYLGISKQDRCITTLPMSYTYGLSILQTHLVSGASIIMYNNSVLSEKFCELIKRHQVTTFGGVPYTYEMLMKNSFFKHKHSSLRYITQAGGRLPSNLVTAVSSYCKKNDYELIVMYGQAEATARMTYLPRQYTDAKPGSIGIPIPMGKISLQDEFGNIINENQVTGEIIYSGPNVMLGYANDIYDLEKGDELGGVLYTGDLAHKDKDGFYYIDGRKSRFIKMQGIRINLDDIEKFIRNYNIACLCGGQDDLLRIHVFQFIDQDFIKSIVSNNFNINKNFIQVLYDKEIPRNESGKIIYKDL